MIENRRNDKKESDLYSSLLKIKKMLFREEWNEQIDSDRSPMKLLLKIKIVRKKRNEKNIWCNIYMVFILKRKWSPKWKRHRV